VEKYLNDTISTNRLALEDAITGRNLMPNYLVRRQFKADSTRAAEWARQNGDSTRWIKYQTPSFRYMMMDTSYGSKSPLYANLHRAVPYKSALAERLAKIKAQAEAEQHAADAAASAARAQDSGRTQDAGRSKDSGRTPDSGTPRPVAPRVTPPAAPPVSPVRPRTTDSGRKAQSSPPPHAPATDTPIHKDSTR